MTSAYEVTLDALGALLGGEPGYRTRQVWEGLHRRALRPGEMTDLPRPLRDHLDEQLPPALTEVASRAADNGATTKWLFALDDGSMVETVLMRYDDRTTVCVSTQAGCAMGCRFCATGQQGFTRHLREGEIVEQVVAAMRAVRPDRVRNVVFMGMGEPLSNFDRLWAAIERLHGAMGFSARHLTVSTVGIVPGIVRLASAPLPVNLAVSLHAANDVLRDQLVPINRRYPLGPLLEACARYVDATHRRLSVEWALIDGVNDRPSDADELAEVALGLRAHVNLIPLNPTPGYLVRGSAPDRVRAFRDHLADRHVNVTVRSTRGVEIDAACGQLAVQATASEPVTVGRRPGSAAGA